MIENVIIQSDAGSVLKTLKVRAVEALASHYLVTEDTLTLVFDTAKVTSATFHHPRETDEHRSGHEHEAQPSMRPELSAFYCDCFAFTIDSEHSVSSFTEIFLIVY